MSARKGLPEASLASFKTPRRRKDGEEGESISIGRGISSRREAKRQPYPCARSTLRRRLITLFELAGHPHNSVDLADVLHLIAASGIVEKARQVRSVCACSPCLTSTLGEEYSRSRDDAPHGRWTAATAFR